MKLFEINFALVIFSVIYGRSGTNDTSPTPVVLWHGLSESCCDGNVKGWKETIEQQIPGVYVKSLQIGDTKEQDVVNGYIMNVNKQVRSACSQISNDEKLKNGYHSVGFSQGGQFLRAVAQRCPNPTMKNYISIGGQQQGVYGIPKCPENISAICDLTRELCNDIAYLNVVQSFVVQAEYWHDPLNEGLYRNKSVFIADINNEKWFGFYTPGQSTIIQQMNETDLYIEDRIGLRTLNDQGKLIFLSVDADHLKFSTQWFIDEIIDPYLKTF